MMAKQRFKALVINAHSWWLSILGAIFFARKFALLFVLKKIYGEPKDKNVCHFQFVPAWGRFTNTGKDGYLVFHFKGYIAFGHFDDNKCREKMLFGLTPFGGYSARKVASQWSAAPDPTHQWASFFTETLTMFRQKFALQKTLFQSPIKVSEIPKLLESILGAYLCAF